THAGVHHPGMGDPSGERLTATRGACQAYHVHDTVVVYVVRLPRQAAEMHRKYLLPPRRVGRPEGPGRRVRPDTPAVVKGERAMDPVIIVSADGHGSMPPELWPEYLDKKYHYLLPQLVAENKLYNETMWLLNDMQLSPDNFDLFDADGVYQAKAWQGLWDL